MAIADVDYEAFQPSRQSEQDATLLVRFYLHPVLDKTQSETRGRPIYVEKEYVEISVPGSRGGVKRRATHQDKERFPKHYAAFQNRVSVPEEGTLLAEWPPISRSVVEELAFHNIKTVEQLASVSDALCQQFMGGGLYKQKAQKWLDNANSGLTVQKLQDELAQRDELMQQMQAQIDQLMGALTNANNDECERE